MKSLRIFSLLFALVALISCGNQPNDKGEFIIDKPNGGGQVVLKFFDNGKIEYIKEIKNEQPEGYFLEFYKTGAPKGLINVINGQKQGTGLTFYPDGSLNNCGEYKDDQQSGYFWVWDKKKNLVEKREYVNVKGNRQINQWIKYNSVMQPVLAESNYVILSAAKDTIKQGESYELNVTLAASFNDEYMAVIVGPFKDDYSLDAGSKCDTILGKNFVAQYKTSNYKSGSNTIKGIVKDMSVDESKKNAKSRNIYFTKEFFVLK